MLLDLETRMGKASRRNPENPLVFLDITVGGEPLGRIVLELFKDVVPKVRFVGQSSWSLTRSYIRQQLF